MSRPQGVLLPLLLSGGLAACAAREPAPSTDTPTSWHAGQRFSLNATKLDLSRLPPAPADPGIQGAGTIPLTTSDPRYAEYFAELKRRIEAKWSYPAEAARQGQSGHGELRFVVRRDGSLRTVDIVRSSGARILDSYISNAIRMAQPFPPIPAVIEGDELPISINFTYSLKGGQ